MNLVKVLFGLCFILFVFCKDAPGINVQLKQNEIEAAVKNGVDHGRKDIFNSRSLQHACINFWPKRGGILVRSKFVDLTVTAAMRHSEKQKISDKEIKDIISSPYLKIEARTNDDVIILLKQNGKIIESVDIDYEDPCCELCEHSGGTKHIHEHVTSSFPYSSIDPKAKTTIIVKGPFQDREYNVNLSKMK